MQASAQATAVAAKNVTAGLVMRLVIAAILATLMLLTWWPSVVHSQSAVSRQSTDGSYTVTTRAGEQLQDIAKRFYGDTAKWRELAAANGLSTDNGKLSVKVGTQLRIPGKSAAEVAAIVRASTPALAAASGVNEASSARASADSRPLERSGVRIGIVSPDDMRAARGKDEPTIFLGHTEDSGKEALRAIEAAIRTHSPPRPREAEYAAAPYAAGKSALERSGRVVARATADGEPEGSFARSITIADEAIVRLPAGSSAAVAQRYITVVPGAALPGGSRVLVPTGVLEITRSEPGKPVVARVVRQSGVIEEGQAILPLEGSAAAVGVTAVASDADEPLRARVRYVQGDQLLSTLQTFLVIDATENQGVQQGDEFWLVEAAPDGSGAEQRIAVVRIVRTTSHGSTGIVIHQDRPGIDVGVAVRRAARASSGPAN